MNKDIDLSKDQSHALDSLVSWHNKKPSGYITLGGYAGTGKTTLIAILRRELHAKTPKLKVGFASYTGKASRVLNQKLNEQKAVFPKDTVGTIHSLIYSPMVNSKEEIIGWTKKEHIAQELIIIDEASMVDKNIWADLCSFGVPIIAVGDHGQLPPINGNFNLLEKPILELQEIHRQAKDNPIIKLSIIARTHGSIPTGSYSPGVHKMERRNPEAGARADELLNDYNKDTLVLCGYNSTRIKLNNHIRAALGFEDIAPQTNDRVICLRNNHTEGIFNGMIGTIQSIKRKDEGWFDTQIQMDGERSIFSGLIAKQQFNSTEALNFTKDRSKIMKGDLFDFGYALTVHKAQGSQAKRVILFEERFKQMDEQMWRRWLYTAVTRAEEELFIFA